MIDFNYGTAATGAATVGLSPAIVAAPVAIVGLATWAVEGYALYKVWQPEIDDWKFDQNSITIRWTKTGTTPDTGPDSNDDKPCKIPGGLGCIPIPPAPPQPPGSPPRTCPPYCTVRPPSGGCEQLAHTLGLGTRICRFVEPPRPPAPINLRPIVRSMLSAGARIINIVGNLLDPTPARIAMAKTIPGQPILLPTTTGDRRRVA